MPDSSDSRHGWKRIAGSVITYRLTARSASPAANQWPRRSTRMAQSSGFPVSARWSNAQRARGMADYMQDMRRAAEDRLPSLRRLPDHRPPCAGCNGYRFVGQDPCPKCAGKGFEAPCLKCEGKRTLDCPKCIGVGNTSCEKCDGNSKVHEVDVASKKFETSSSVTWHVRPQLPNHVLNVIEKHLPSVREETLDRPEQAEVAVLGLRRLHHQGPVEVVRFNRMFTTTIVAYGNRIIALPRGVAKTLPNDWFSG